MLYLCLKSLHVVFVITWFAGLFYLPRLFVYHADATDAVSDERFRVMERRLFIMMTLGATLAVLFGLTIIALQPAWLAATWLRIKLLLVLGLLGYHLWCWRLVGDFRHGRNRHSSRWYRGFNEIPSVLLVAIVFLAILKPA
jgi:putative membrane protein